MTRETEAVTLLRADATLAVILTGGIYSYGDLGEEGIGDPDTTPDVYSSGVMLPTAIVKQRALVPSFEVRDDATQAQSASQALEVYVYQSNETALDRIYALLQGYAFDGAYKAAWVNTIGPVPAPELARADVTRIDFQVISIRRVA